MRKVRGFHGTIIEYAEDMAKGNFKEPDDKTARWLGRGIYFFEENSQLAHYWATKLAHEKGSTPAIVIADIELSDCLDLTQPVFQAIVRRAHGRLAAQWEADPTSKKPDQKPFSLLADGQVATGYRGEWARYGKNELDFQVVEEAIVVARDQENLKFKTVRGAFLEYGPLYKNSWFYEGAHVAIAVREPYDRISNISCSPVG
jgi:hypothetical protein